MKNIWSKNIFLLFSLMIFSQNQCCLYEKFSDKKWQYGIGTVAVILGIFGLVYWYKNSRISQDTRDKLKEVIGDKKIDKDLGEIVQLIEKINGAQKNDREQHFSDLNVMINQKMHNLISLYKTENKTNEKSVIEELTRNHDIGKLVCSLLAKDACVSLFLYLNEKGQDYTFIFEWFVKNNLHIFFAKVDKHENTLLHGILMQELDYTMFSSFEYLFEEIAKQDNKQDLLETKNDDNETIICSLFKNPHYKEKSFKNFDYFKLLINSGINLNVKSKENKKSLVFYTLDFKCHVTKINLLWLLFNKDIFDYEKLPQKSSLLSFFKEKSESISIEWKILKKYIGGLQSLHEWAEEELNKDNETKKQNSRDAYTQSYGVLYQANEIVRKNDQTFSPIKMKVLRTFAI